MNIIAGKVVDVIDDTHIVINQERITTLISCRTKTKNNRRVITRKSPLTLPFENVERGCLFKQIGG